MQEAGVAGWKKVLQLLLLAAPSQTCRLVPTGQRNPAASLGKTALTSSRDPEPMLIGILKGPEGPKSRMERDS